MAKTRALRVSAEEEEVIKTLRAQGGAPAIPDPSTTPTQAQQNLADAFVAAIERTRKPEKKTIANRVKNTPWTPKDGSPRAKLKRKMYHHSIQIAEHLTNEEIMLLNKIRPGYYCAGFVRVVARKDRGIDVDYPVKTASQRLRLVNQFGIRSFKELLERIVDEYENPTKYKTQEDIELYD